MEYTKDYILASDASGNTYTYLDCTRVRDLLGLWGEHIEVLTPAMVLTKPSSGEGGRVVSKALYLWDDVYELMIELDLVVDSVPAKSTNYTNFYVFST
jgi:hypothetical protein